MLTWILSLLGAGGTIAALVFVPGLAARALGLIKDYPWQVGLAISLCANVVLWRGWDHANDQRDAKASELNTEIAKHAVTRSSLTAALANIDRQNKAVDELKRQSDAREAAAQAALRVVQGQRADTEATIAAMRAQANLPPTADCRTHDAVMNGRDGL